MLQGFLYSPFSNLLQNITNIEFTKEIKYGKY